MDQVINLKTLNGQAVAFVDRVIGSGRMKDVYFSPDKSYVVAFYREPQNQQSKERLQMITGQYKAGIFKDIGAEYWQNLYCWPSDVVEYQGRLGIVVPTYRSCFFFAYGSKNNDFLNIKGKEKEGKWFASANNQNRFLAEQERGNWRNYLRICILLSRAVRRLHAAGLAHSDLSYKNVLVDPVSGSACMIDLDGLVVPGKYPPDVVGTPDFIAPEVIRTQHLPMNDPQRRLPSIETDRHALAILIYMYLLYRHPLRGDKIFDSDPQKDEEMAMGAGALFIEHPTDRSNRIQLAQLKESELPWKNTDKMPYTVTGPYLQPLFEQAFITGLHDPGKRPTADSWEVALVKTIDLIQPCYNPACGQKWYIFDNTTKPVCPFCQTPYRGSLPILNLYSQRSAGKFTPDQHRLMVYSEQSLFLWHTNRSIVPNERLSEAQIKRVGYFIFHQNVWYLVNERLAEIIEVDGRKVYQRGDKIALTEGLKLQFSREADGRLAVVQLVG